MFTSWGEVVLAEEISNQTSENVNIASSENEIDSLDDENTETDLANGEEAELTDDFEFQESPGLTKEKRDLLQKFPFESVVGFPLDVYRDRPLSEIYLNCSDKVGAIYSSEFIPNLEPYYNVISNGFFISPDGYFLTTYRQIKDIFNLTEADIGSGRIIKLKTSLSLKLIDLAVIKVDSEADLVLFKANLNQIDVDSVPFVEIIPDYRLAMGQSIFGIGFPELMAKEGGLYPGFVTEIGIQEIQESGNEMTQYKSSMIIPNTSSGSLIVNSSGHPVGISTVNEVNFLSDRYSIIYPLEEVFDRLEYLFFSEEEDNKATIGLKYISDLDYENIRTTFNLPRGLYISKSYINGPAYVSDIRQGDILISINNIPITTFNEFEDVFDPFVPGDAIQIKIYRPNLDRFYSKTLYLD